MTLYQNHLHFGPSTGKWIRNWKTFISPYRRKKKPILQTHNWVFILLTVHPLEDFFISFPEHNPYWKETFKWHEFILERSLIYCKSYQKNTLWLKAIHTEENPNSRKFILEITLDLHNAYWRKTLFRQSIQEIKFYYANSCWVET